MEIRGFEKLVARFNEIEKEDAFDAIEDFFAHEEEKNYRLPDDLQENEKDAIHALFGVKKDLVSRIQDALIADPFCIEASFIVLKCFDEPMIFKHFDSLRKNLEFYDEISDYNKKCLQLEMENYFEFLLDIRNISHALKVERELCAAKGGMDEDDIIRYSYVYMLLERSDEFYDFYRNTKFRSPIPYLMLLVTLLKAGNEERAEEVLEDMNENVPGTECLKNFDSETEDSDILDFMDALTACYEAISGYPVFFEWCEEHIGSDVGEA